MAKKGEFLFYKKNIFGFVGTIQGDLVSNFQLIMTIFEGGGRVFPQSFF